jgi:hypothetical protein
LQPQLRVQKLLWILSQLAPVPFCLLLPRLQLPPAAFLLLRLVLASAHTSVPASLHVTAAEVAQRYQTCALARLRPVLLLETLPVQLARLSAMQRNQRREEFSLVSIQLASACASE